MSKKADSNSVTSLCAVVVITGIMLSLSTHHGSNGLESTPWIHAATDVVAILLISSPFFIPAFQSVVAAFSKRVS